MTRRIVFLALVLVLLAALGLSVPKTLAEFEALMAAAKAAGETPITFGNLDQWPGIHIFSAIQHVLQSNRTWLDDFVYGRNDVSFQTPENVAAAAKAQEWVDAGYFTEGFAGIGYDDSWKMFAGGQGLMMLTGSWLSGDIVGTGGEKFGFLLLPGQTDGTPLSIGGVGLPFCIRAGTANADLAAAHLDSMVSTKLGELWLEKGVLSAVPVDTAKVPPGTLQCRLCPVLHDLANPACPVPAPLYPRHDERRGSRLKRT